MELIVTDDQGKPVYTTGTVDQKGFIQPGTFMFKAEPVDQYGNLIDRHNLWEMVGVRHRRALFPGFSDSAEFAFYCPQLAPVRIKVFPQNLSYTVAAPGTGARTLRIRARLLYRKVDQFLLNFMFGADKGLTAPVTEMASEVRTVEVSAAGSAGARHREGAD